MIEHNREDTSNYKITLALYLQSCQEEYRSTHKNCTTCALCQDRNYTSLAKCKITMKEVGSSNWGRAIRANLCKYYTPYID